MAAKNRHGLFIVDMLIDLIMSLTPSQQESLYNEILPRYTKRARVKIYNEEGVEDQINGKIRLLPHQYKTIRTKFGDSFMKKAFLELSNYIRFLEKNIDNPQYKQKLKKLNQGTHNAVIATPNGWVYQKCKGYITQDRPSKLAVNPYLIDDYNTAYEYVKSMPRIMRENAMEVQMLIRKFPELADIDDEE